MFIAPRTTQAPVSGVQKMAGLSAALNIADPAVRTRRPGTSSRVGKTGSLSAGPPSSVYLSAPRHRAGARRWLGEEHLAAAEILGVSVPDGIDVAILGAQRRIVT